MREFSARCKLMGSDFELLLVQEDRQKADELLDLGLKEIKRIENLLSEFLPVSVTTTLNNNSWSKPLSIDDECFDLIARCLDISKLTKGCFDITVSPLKSLYSFNNELFEMPPAKQINETLQTVGYRKIELNAEQKSVLFKNDRTKISFAAIGKGYASDMVKKLWIKEGVESGIINASGDLNAFGSKPDGTKWRIGIANPDDASIILMYIPVENASVATSGDYEQFFMHNNIRYSHNINPHTGLPMTGIKSVSVFSPSAELSDALATAIYVMGKKDGIDFANHLPQTHCIIIDDQNGIYFSKNLKYEKTVI
jgi:FAD:protein FMN transferase